MKIEYQIEGFMDYCVEKGLSKKTCRSYEQTLVLLARYLKDEKSVNDAENVKTEMIRDYIKYIRDRGKYTVSGNDKSKIYNHPEKRRDYGKKVSDVTINNYIRNAGKKRASKENNNEVNQWVRKDMERTKRVGETGRQTFNNLRELSKSTSSIKPTDRMDLSSMSDREMREKINRELLERQYNDVFNQKKVSKGRYYTEKTLEIGGGVLGTTASALSIALAIKELRGL